MGLCCLSSFQGERSGSRVFPPGSAEMRELETAYEKAISAVSPTPFVTTFFATFYGETDLTLAKLSSPTPSERELSTCVDRGSGTVL
jgi:hypothetical protein